MEREKPRSETFECDTLTEPEHLALGMRRPRIRFPLLPVPRRQSVQRLSHRAGSGIEDHRLVRRIAIVSHAPEPRLRRFPLPRRRERRPVRQPSRHPKLHVDPQLALSSERRPEQASPRRREGVFLAGVAVVVGVVSRDLVPGPLHAGGIEPRDGGRGTSGLPSVGVGPPFQYGDLDAFVVFDGAFEESVEVGGAVSCEASGDAGVVAHAFGDAGQTFATVGVVLEAGLGLDGATIDEATSVDEGGVEAFGAVFGVELVFGVGGGELVVGQMGEEGIGEKEEGETERGADGGDGLFEGLEFRRFRLKFGWARPWARGRTRSRMKHARET